MLLSAVSFSKTKLCLEISSARPSVIVEPASEPSASSKVIDAQSSVSTGFTRVVQRA